MTVEEMLRNLCDMPIVASETTYYMDKEELEKKYGHIKPYKKPCINMQIDHKKASERVKKAWAKRKQITEEAKTNRLNKAN